MNPSIGPLAFKYQPSIGAEAGNVYLLHSLLVHLEMPRSTVRIIYLYFSRALNTIPSYWAKCCRELKWTTILQDKTTSQPQYVRAQNCESDRLLCSIRAAQGIVLSSFLFTLYTSEFTYSSSICPLQMFYRQLRIHRHRQR